MNTYDEIKINLEELYCIARKIKPTDRQVYKPRILNFLKMYLSGLMVKSGFRQRMMYAGFIQSWFTEFLVFWKDYLRGRPIDILDFHFLRMHFRTKFQNVEHVNEDDNDAFLNAWSKPETLYVLLSAVWNYSKVNYLSFYHMLRFLPRSGLIVEYGCGIAPVTRGLVKYLPHRKYQFLVCDILQINYIYALFMLGKYSNVESKLLTPYRNTVDMSEEVSAIICVTVLEHIPNPLVVVQSFFKSLRSGGIFIFDYVMSEGMGLDSKKSTMQRNETLLFIENNFEIVHGTIDKSKNVGFTVVVKT